MKFSCLKVMADFKFFSFQFKWPWFGNMRWASPPWSATLPEATQQLLSCLKMTGIAQVAVSLNKGLPGSLQWQKCMSWSRKCFFLSSEMEKTQLKHHTHTHTHCAINGDDGKLPNTKWHNTHSMGLLEQIL